MAKTESKLKENQEIIFEKKLKQSDIYIHFCDGKFFKGKVNRSNSNSELKEGIWGEAAFTTGMSGYQETSTDPSFLGQHIIFTSSHIGNYEANNVVNQSSGPHGTCLIARNFSYNKFLEEIEIPLISGIDTRAITLYLSRESQNHISIITTNPIPPNKEEFTKDKIICSQLSFVSQKEKEILIDGANPIVLVNYGVKKSIVDNLKKFNIPLISVPYDTSFREILALNPRMIFLSNGPGDPRSYLKEINEIKKILETNIPVRGICLGHQLLALALEIDILKLPFGQRGSNHPVFCHRTGDLLITSQNHGYAVCSESFKKYQKLKNLDFQLYIEYTSLFDRSIEGIRSNDSKLRSVQFHPEASPGPLDAKIFFIEIQEYLAGNITDTNIAELKEIPNYHKGHLKSEFKKILLIGSGPIKIGQASEFDYSGTQALKSLKELGIKVVLLNSNPATIMTDKKMGYRTYIEPITKEVIKKIIKKEQVDAVLSTMGGQTALNMCIELEEENFLKKNNVALLGANVDTIKKTEDRNLFAIELNKLGYKSGKRFQAGSAEIAFSLAEAEIGFPLIIRRDFALGGKGAALVYNKEELQETFDSSNLKFPITMEKSLVGYKEVELEVMVDKNKNGIIICSIENIDPCGIHTGDSITVAPAQTISDRCYQKLRIISLDIAKHMNVVAGGANVQFAVDPKDEDNIIVIEMNPRVSRSSALASKATGYPIAKISARLAVGLTLFEILNDITKISPVAFEPTLDYVALKIPIFPFNKFPTSSQILGPQMRSVGEVLALGGSFNEAFMKALRSTEQGLEIPSLTSLKTTPISITKEYVLERLKSSKELVLLTVLDGLRVGISFEDICEITGITPWFIGQMTKIIHLESQLKANTSLLEDKETFIEYKYNGFSDKYLALLSEKNMEIILDYRIQNKVLPIYKSVDTCSGEFKASTPYFYSTYSSENEVTPLSDTEQSIVIFGSGPNRIGQGIEFDYSSVKSCDYLATKKIKSIMLNSNPETVSTDYDSSDRLYLTPLFSEDLFDILYFEKPTGVITSFSGQTGINIRKYIDAEYRKKYYSPKFLGPSLKILDLVEDRKEFDNIISNTRLMKTKSKEIRGYKNLLDTMTEIGLPVIIRPSYVIGGESMYIFKSMDDLNEIPRNMREGLERSMITFQVENYLENTLEYDVDLIRDYQGHTIFTICEHIEHAGVHSGDSGMISPPVKSRKKIIEKMRGISIELANKLEIVGPINFQFGVKGEGVYCIEANPRGSRTLPFLSKAYNVNLPAMATKALLGEEFETINEMKSDYFVVKQSTFPFDRFIDDSTILGPKMRSTGETLGIDLNLQTAIIKSYLGNYPGLLNKGRILISLSNKSKEILDLYLEDLIDCGYSFMGTRGTCRYIQKKGHQCQEVAKLGEKGSFSMLDAIKEDNLILALNTPLNMGTSKSDGEFIRNMSIQYGIPCFTREENIHSILTSIISSSNKEIFPVSLQDATNE